jgi:hypothetical protein
MPGSATACDLVEGLAMMLYPFFVDDEILAVLKEKPLFLEAAEV